jgi:hypothetical protein
MTQMTVPNRTDNRARQYHFHVRISLVLSTLLILTSCSSTSSSHLNSSATTATSVTSGTVSPNPYPPHQGTLVLDDPLRDNSHGYNWDQSTSSCQFSNNAYHVATSLKSYSFWCAAFGTNFSNFAYEAQMTIIKGDSGGLMFRADADKSKVYYFRIDQTGYFMFIVYTGHTSGNILAKGTISAFHTGMGQSNLVAVVAQRDHLTLYANHQSVKTVTNPTFSQGQIGFGASNYDSPVEVVFTDAKVWRL